MPNCAECGTEVIGKEFKRRVCFDCKQKRKRLAAYNYLQAHPKPKHPRVIKPKYAKAIKQPVIKIKESVETLWERLLRRAKERYYD